MSPRPTLRACAALSLAVTVIAGATTPAGADPLAIPGTAGATTVTDAPEPARPAFYEPPAEIPSAPGTLIRQEKTDNILDPLDVSSANFDARRVMYSSLDREGNPIAVTGFVVSPRAKWIGVSKRPLISLAAGTQGMGDRCAPSRMVQQVSEYEVAFMSSLLIRGYPCR